jgi:hypothetical protein
LSREGKWNAAAEATANRALLPKRRFNQLMRLDDMARQLHRIRHFDTPKGEPAMNPTDRDHPTPSPPQSSHREQSPPDDAPKGNLDLDRQPQINNQHLEVR